MKSRAETVAAQILSYLISTLEKPMLICEKFSGF